MNAARRCRELLRLDRRSWIPASLCNCNAPESARRMATRRPLSSQRWRHRLCERKQISLSDLVLSTPLIGACQEESELELILFELTTAFSSAAAKTSASQNNKAPVSPEGELRRAGRTNDRSATGPILSRLSPSVDHLLRVLHQTALRKSSLRIRHNPPVLTLRRMPVHGRCWSTTATARFAATGRAIGRSSRARAAHIETIRKSRSNIRRSRLTTF